MSTSILGRYELVAPIGRGGMAEVWKARVTGPSGFEKILAIKRVLPEISEDQEFVASFVDEAKLVADLVHPNIVQVLDFGREGSEYFMALEFVEGGNLSQLLAALARRGERLPHHLAMFIALEACRGLGYVHARADAKGEKLGIVHRDVSPHNVLLSSAGDVKISDFGIAKARGSIARTGGGMVKGKVAYMSPEQATGRPLDGNTDLYSLGLVLFEMLTGQRFFGGGSNEEILVSIARLRNDTVQEKTESLPPVAREALRTALEPISALRFKDAAAFEAALVVGLDLERYTKSRQELAALVRQEFGTGWQEKALVGNEATLRPSVPPVPPLPPTAKSRPVRQRVRLGILATAFSVVALGGFLKFGPGGPGVVATPAPTTAPIATPEQTLPPPVSPDSTPMETVIAATATPTPAIVSPPIAHGEITVTARPWANVSIDGGPDAETPLRDRKVRAGPRRVRVTHPSGFTETRTVDVPKDGSVHVYVDVEAKTIEVEQQP